MRIVVNTHAGTIGRVVVERLLEAKHDVVVISRHPEKVAAMTARGGTLMRGSIDEDVVAERALEGADALFWLTPIAFEFEPLNYGLGEGHRSARSVKPAVDADSRGTRADYDQSGAEGRPDLTVVPQWAQSGEGTISCARCGISYRQIAWR